MPIALGVWKEIRAPQTENIPGRTNTVAEGNMCHFYASAATTYFVYALSHCYLRQKEGRSFFRASYVRFMVRHPRPFMSTENGRTWCVGLVETKKPPSLVWNVGVGADGLPGLKDRE